MVEKTVAIVGARLNSSRLPRKHLFDLAGRPVIHHIIRRLQAIAEIDHIILATTDDDYNADLVTWAQGAGVDVYAHKGDVNDLMGRVDAVVKKHDPDIITYVCGDSPLLHPPSVSGLITALKADKAAGLVTFAEPKPVHSGVDIYRRFFWDAMVAATETPFEREHVGSVWHYSKKVLPDRVAHYADGPRFVDIHHRLSVDTPHDYMFMRRVYDRWYRERDDHSLVDLDWLVDQLQKDPSLANINGRVRQRTVADKPLHVTLLAEAGSGIGLGHLTRILIIALALQERLAAKTEVLILGTPVDHPLIKLINHRWIAAPLNAIGDLGLDGADVLVSDLKTTPSFFWELRDKGPLLIGIDSALEQNPPHHYHWMPSIYLDPPILEKFEGRLTYGADCFLLKPDYLLDIPAKPADGGRRVLALTGGADPAGLNATLPADMLDSLPDDTELHWAVGPYAGPVTHTNDRLHPLESPTNIPDILPTYDLAFCVFGVTFYECLQARVPVVCFDALGAATPGEWAYLKSQFPDLMADSMADAFEKMSKLLHRTSPLDLGSLPDELAKGPNSLADFINQLAKDRQE